MEQTSSFLTSRKQIMTADTLMETPMTNVEDYNFPFLVQDYTESNPEDWDNKTKAVFATNYYFESGRSIKGMTPKEVVLDKLSAGQPTVKPDVVEFYRNSPKSLYDEDQVGTQDLPVVVQVDNEFIVTNGNHRIVAGLVRGEQTAKVLLIPHAPTWCEDVQQNAYYKLDCWAQGLSA